MENRLFNELPRRVADGKAPHDPGERTLVRRPLEVNSDAKA